MTRSILCGLLALISVGALGVVPIACQSGGVGDPCTPEVEYGTPFAGFNITQEFIESRSFQCSTRLCLVNHFQGRVSRPLGQPLGAVQSCSPHSNPTGCTDPDAKCVEADTQAPECTCDSNKPGDCASQPACISGTVCDSKLQLCTCTDDQTINGTTYYCSLVDPTCTGQTCAKVLKSYLCHKPGDCQTADGTNAQNENKQCCVPGTETPVGVPVCGQCETKSHRDANSAVYCSCRCGVADGDPAEPDFNFCKCPTDFTCSEIRPDVSLGDPLLTGKYCIRTGTEFTVAEECGNVVGAFNTGCSGLSVSLPTGDGG